MLKNKTLLHLKIIATLSLLLLTACATRTQDLAFETLKDSLYSNYSSKRIGFIVVNSAAESEKLHSWLRQDDLTLAQEVDYERYFLIIAFKGWYHRAHQGLYIDRITYQYNTISISAWMGIPQGDQAPTSPYHMVKVERMDDLASVESFILIVDDEVEAIINQPSIRISPLLPLMSSPLKPLPPASTRPPTRTAYPTKEPPLQTQSSSKKGRWRFDNGTWKFDIVEE